MKWWQFFMTLSAVYGSPRVTPWLGTVLSLVFLAYGIYALRKGD